MGFIMVLDITCNILGRLPYVINVTFMTRCEI